MTFSVMAVAASGLRLSPSTNTSGPVASDSRLLVPLVTEYLVSPSAVPSSATMSGVLMALISIEAATSSPWSKFSSGLTRAMGRPGSAGTTPPLVGAVSRRTAVVV